LHLLRALQLAVKIYPLSERVNLIVLEVEET